MDQLRTGQRVTRRELLKHSAVGMVLAPWLGYGAPTKAEEGTEKQQDSRMSGAIDAHVHVWTPDVKQYPLAPPYTPAQMQPPSFTPKQLLAHAEPCGVRRIVLIQMSYYGFDNRYMLDTIREFPGVFSGVAIVDERAPGLRGTMLDLKKQGVRGFRIHPAQQAVGNWLFGPPMAQMWKIGADEQLAMCALVNPEALVPLDKMCQQFPGTRLVIDHFARIGIDGTIRDSDVDNLCRLARHKLVSVKISAFYALGRKKPPYTDLGPMTRRLLDAFGPERLMWASDSPFQVDPGHTYRDSIDLVRERLDFLSSVDREWILRKTAERVFFS
jgi:predicted TIM-barrel fold metal-dependent hydrolase